MFFESVSSSWAGRKNMVGFPMFPVCLPCEEGGRMEWRWMKEVRWVRIHVGADPVTGEGGRWIDSHWF